jgi:MFS superfamily sulfate permease-like transporter
MIAVLLSLTALLYRASRPYIAVLGKLRGEHATYVDIERHPDSEPIPGLLIIRIDAPLYFFNANVAHDQILALVDSADPRPTVVVIDIGASADFDVTATDALRELTRQLTERSIALWLAQVKGAVRDRLRRTGLMAELGEDAIFLSIAAAVAAHDELDQAGPTATTADVAVGPIA